MGIVNETVSLDADTLARVQTEMRDHGVDAWLLYDFRGLNPVAVHLLGLPAMTRRYFVLIPSAGAPIALTHRIEQQPWQGWIGENRPYSSWRELEAGIAALVRDHGVVAMESSESDAVPYVDHVPAGVVQMVMAAGATVRSSGDLVSAFHSRWTAEGEASHRRAGAVLKATADAAFSRIGAHLAAGDEITEWSLRQWITEALTLGGLAVGSDAIVAVNANAANPHYAPTAAHAAVIRPGDLILVDLWGKEDEDSIYADQTWMAYAGEEVPARQREIFGVVRDARDAVVTTLEERWSAGERIAGFELDDVAREVIGRGGYAEHFIHRTGHSIDRELHGSGPNLDNLETRDTRWLIPGIGFSVEPGIYLTGDLGFRSEIDVWIGPAGPEVTTPDPQREIALIPVR